MNRGEIRFLTLEDVLALHGMQIERYGGASGIRDQGLLESAVGQRKSQMKNPTTMSPHKSEKTELAKRLKKTAVIFSYLLGSGESQRPFSALQVLPATDLHQPQEGLELAAAFRNQKAMF